MNSNSAEFQLHRLQLRVRELETRMLQLEDRVVFDAPAQPYNPDADVRELTKWLNEEPNRFLNRQALARVLAYLQ